MLGSAISILEKPLCAIWTARHDYVKGLSREAKDWTSQGGVTKEQV